jgi:hypothetical protein
MAGFHDGTGQGAPFLASQLIGTQELGGGFGVAAGGGGFGGLTQQSMDPSSSAAAWMMLDATQTQTQTAGLSQVDGFWLEGVVPNADTTRLCLAELGVSVNTSDAAAMHDFRSP